jgi:hypothetical protein
MEELPEVKTPTRAPHEGHIPSAEGAAHAPGVPLWRDYLAYFTVRRLLTVVYALVVMEFGAWVSLSLLPSDLAGLQRAVSGQDRSEQLMQPDSFLGHRLRPGFEMVYKSEGRPVRVNTTSFGLGDVGFRDLGMKPPFDLVALGDSFTYCDDISPEGCWLRLLGDKTGLSVGDLGVPGYSTMAQARMLERYGAPLHPRIVLMTVFANDFRDNEQFEQWLRSGSDDFPKWLGQKRQRGAVGNTLARHSVVFRIFLAVRRAGSLQMEKYKDGTLDLAFSFDPWWIKLSKHAEDSAGFRLMQQALLAMQAQAEQMGAQLVVLLLPTKEEVYWDIARQYVKEDVDIDHPRAVVRAFCEEKGLKFCDFTDGLRAEAHKGRQLYLRVSGHWNEAGHAFMAAATARCLRAQKVMDLTTARP